MVPPSTGAGVSAESTESFLPLDMKEALGYFSQFPPPLTNFACLGCLVCTQQSGRPWTPGSEKDDRSLELSLVDVPKHKSADFN